MIVYERCFKFDGIPITSEIHDDGTMTAWVPGQPLEWNYPAASLKTILAFRRSHGGDRDIAKKALAWWFKDNRDSDIYEVLGDIEQS